MHIQKRSLSHPVSRYGWSAPNAAHQVPQDSVQFSGDTADFRPLLTPKLTALQTDGARSVQDRGERSRGLGEPNYWLEAPDGDIFIAHNSKGEEGSHLLLVSPTGELRWQASLDDKQILQVGVSESGLVGVRTPTSILAIDADGETVFRETLRHRATGGPHFDSKDNIYFLDWHGKLRSLDRAGAVRHLDSTAGGASYPRLKSLLKVGPNELLGSWKKPNEEPAEHLISLELEKHYGTPWMSHQPSAGWERVELSDISSLGKDQLTALERSFAPSEDGGVVEHKRAFFDEGKHTWTSPRLYYRLNSVESFESVLEARYDLSSDPVNPTATLYRHTPNGTQELDVVRGRNSAILPWKEGDFVLFQGHQGLLEPGPALTSKAVLYSSEGERLKEVGFPEKTYLVGSTKSGFLLKEGDRTVLFNPDRDETGSLSALSQT